MKKKRNNSLGETGQAPTELAEKKRSPDEPLHIWSWNVNSLRAVVKKGGLVNIASSGAHVVLLQETKCELLPDEVNELDDYPYKAIISSKPSAGYAGVAMLSKEKWVNLVLGIGDEEFDKAARYIQAEFENYFLINIYVPNSGVGLPNLPKRKVWDGLVRKRMGELDKKKPVILVGDMNVAHNEIDLRNPETNRNKTAGFTDQEREDFTKLLKAGPFVDVYRRLNPEEEHAYTYYSYRFNAKQKGIGWRLDYFIVSERIFDRVQECLIHKSVEGSDHVPISMRIAI